MYLPCETEEARADMGGVPGAEWELINRFRDLARRGQPWADGFGKKQ